MKTADSAFCLLNSMKGLGYFAPKSDWYTLVPSLVALMFYALYLLLQRPVIVSVENHVNWGCMYYAIQ